MFPMKWLDRSRGQGSEPPGGSCRCSAGRVVQRRADRVGGQALVAMALRRTCRSRPSGDVRRDPLGKAFLGAQINKTDRNDARGVAFTNSIDDPARFHRSRCVGPALGLTPVPDQSGESQRIGRISLCRSAMKRVLLYEAAQVMLTRMAQKVLAESLGSRDRQARWSSQGSRRASP